MSSIYPNQITRSTESPVFYCEGSHFAEIDDEVKAQCSFGVEGMSMAHVISDTEIECDAPVAHKASAHETQRIKIISERNNTEEQVVTSTVGKAVANEIQAITIASRGDKGSSDSPIGIHVALQEIQTIVSTCSSRDEQQLFGIEVFPEIWEVQRLIVDAPLRLYYRFSTAECYLLKKKRDEYLPTSNEFNTSFGARQVVLDWVPGQDHMLTKTQPSIFPVGSTKTYRMFSFRLLMESGSS